MFFTGFKTSAEQLCQVYGTSVFRGTPFESHRSRSTTIRDISIDESLCASRDTEFSYTIIRNW